MLRPDGPLFFANDGDSRFTIRPGAFRFVPRRRAASPAWPPRIIDRDGRVDLYLCTYSFFRDGGQYKYPVPYLDAQNGPANFLFRNQLTEIGGIFHDATAETGLDQNNNRFTSPRWCDYDGDGWPDLYIANDFGRKNLYKNNDGKFRDVAAEGRRGRYRRRHERRMVRLRWRRAAGPVCVEHVERCRAADRFGKEAAARRLIAQTREGRSLCRNRGDGTFEETGASERSRDGPVGVVVGRESISTTTEFRRFSSQPEC